MKNYENISINNNKQNYNNKLTKLEIIFYYLFGLFVSLLALFLLILLENDLN